MVCPCLLTATEEKRLALLKENDALELDLFIGASTKVLLKFYPFNGAFLLKLDLLGDGGCIVC